jgi:hypothetical protein
VTESHTVTTTNADGTESTESVTTYKYIQRKDRVYMVCGY